VAPLTVTAVRNGVGENGSRQIVGNGALPAEVFAATR